MNPVLFVCKAVCAPDSAWTLPRREKVSTLQGKQTPIPAVAFRSLITILAELYLFLSNVKHTDKCFKHRYRSFWDIRSVLLWDCTQCSVLPTFRHCLSVTSSRVNRPHLHRGGNLKLGLLWLFAFLNLSSIVPRAGGDGHRLATNGAVRDSRVNKRCNTRPTV